MPPSGDQVRHGHDLDNQTRPSSKVLGSLAAARLGVVLLPSKARLLPAVVHGVDKGATKAAVEVGGRSLEGTILERNVLFGMISIRE